MRRLLVVILVVFAVVFGGCGSDEADQATSDSEAGEAADEISTEGAPFGIESMDLPKDEAEVAALFEAMPSEVEGQPRLEDTGLFARYGGELKVVSAGLASDFDTGTVMASLLAFDSEPSAEIEDSELDPDAAALVWLFGTFQDEGGAGKVFVATWGEPDGEWLFSVNAQTPEMREALVQAFVNAS